MSKGDIAAIAGRGFAKAMEVYNLGTGDPIGSGLEEIAHSKTECQDQGRYIADWDLSYYSAMEDRVKRAVVKYVANDPIKARGLTIEDVELVLPEHGMARIDVGARDASRLVVVDYKLKLWLDSKYYDKEVESYRNSWQQFHYAWAYGDHKQEPINSYYICLVVCEPRFSAKLHEYPVHPESLQMWRESAERIWRQMDLEDLEMAQPWMAALHEDKYGPCPMKDACFTHRFDMNLMTQNDYVTIEKRD